MHMVGSQQLCQFGKEELENQDSTVTGGKWSYFRAVMLQVRESITILGHTAANLVQ